VGESAFAGFDFVPRARADHDVERHDIRVIGGHGEEPETVRKVFLDVRVREDFLPRCERCSSQNGGQQCGQSGFPKDRGFRSPFSLPGCAHL
jgi:hypothetical protein